MKNTLKLKLSTGNFEWINNDYMNHNFYGSLSFQWFGGVGQTPESSDTFNGISYMQ